MSQEYRCDMKVVPVEPRWPERLQRLARALRRPPPKPARTPARKEVRPCPKR